MLVSMVFKWFFRSRVVITAVSFIISLFMGMFFNHRISGYQELQQKYKACINAKGVKNQIGTLNDKQRRDELEKWVK